MANRFLLLLLYLFFSLLLLVVVVMLGNLFFIVVLLQSLILFSYGVLLLLYFFITMQLSRATYNNIYVICILSNCCFYFALGPLYASHVRAVRNQRHRIKSASHCL